MSTVLINYDGANQHSVSAGKNDLVRLNPGINKIDAGAWGRIMAAAEEEMTGDNPPASGGVMGLIESGIITEIDSDTKTGAVDFGQMNAKDSINIINGESDLDVLSGMRDGEASGKGRASVLKAITEQMELIEASNSEDKEQE